MSSVFFNNSSKSKLCIFRHIIALIQDHELEARRKEALRRCKSLDLIADDAYAPIIRCIQFQSHLSYLLTVTVPCNRKYCGRFTSSRWSVEQQMRHLPFIDQFKHCIRHVALLRKISKRSWPVLLNPRKTGLHRVAVFDMYALNALFPR